MFLLPNKWRINRLRKLLYSMLEISPSIIAEFVNYFGLSRLVFLLPHPQRSGNMQKKKKAWWEREEDRGQTAYDNPEKTKMEKVISVGTKGKHLHPGYNIP